MTKPSISINMIDAIQAQTELFGLIKLCAQRLSLEILGKDAIVHDNFWRAIDYRSILLTFDVQKAVNKRKHPYGWHIYYNSPTVLVFMEKLRKPDKWVKRLPIDLANDFYFELSDNEKSKAISDFVRKSFLELKIQST